MSKVYLDIDFYDTDFLEHHGIKGMKWGVRRYQNPDGSLTPLGRARRGLGEAAGDFKRGAKRIKRNVKSNVRKLKKNAAKIKDFGKKKVAPKSEAEKLRAIKNGDFKTLSRYMDELTIDQLREADARLTLQKNMAQNYKTVHPEKAGALKKIANTANTIGDIAQGIGKVQQALQLDKKSRMQLANMEANINKTNAEINKIKGETKTDDQGKKTKDKEKKAVDEAKKTLNKIIDDATSDSKSSVDKVIDSVRDTPIKGRYRDSDDSVKISDSRSDLFNARERLFRDENRTNNNTAKDDAYDFFRKKQDEKRYRSNIQDFVDNFDRSAVTRYAAESKARKTTESPKRNQDEWDWFERDNGSDVTPLKKRRKYEL